ncbi:MAG: bacteriocin immunity protein [Microscillaceae bacterium]
MKAATPEAKRVEDIKKEELIWVVERIMEADKNTDYYLALLEKNVPDPAVSDLIFWPSERGYDSDLSAEEIVTIALNHKPI